MGLALCGLLTLREPRQYGIVEVENDMGDESLNDLAGSISSSYDSIPTGYVGGDAIKCGIIYNSDSVMPMGSVAILDSNVDSDFIDTKNRPVVIQTFQEISTGALLTVAVCHFKSKGSKCTDVGDPDPIPDDGTASCNETRRKAAEALGKYLATDPTKSGSSNFLILGDLNSYAEVSTIFGPNELFLTVSPLFFRNHPLLRSRTRTDMLIWNTSSVVKVSTGFRLTVRGAHLITRWPVALWRVKSLAQKPGTSTRMKRF